MVDRILIIVRDFVFWIFGAMMVAKNHALCAFFVKPHTGGVDVFLIFLF